MERNLLTNRMKIVTFARSFASDSSFLRRLPAVRFHSPSVCPARRRRRYRAYACHAAGPTRPNRARRVGRGRRTAHGRNHDRCPDTTETRRTDGRADFDRGRGEAGNGVLCELELVLLARRKRRHLRTSTDFVLDAGGQAAAGWDRNGNSRPIVAMATRTTALVVALRNGSCRES